MVRISAGSGKAGLQRREIANPANAPACCMMIRGFGCHRISTFNVYHVF
jgi:hypothetical protein